jgi:hypothetical protein
VSLQVSKIDDFGDSITFPRVWSYLALVTGQVLSVNSAHLSNCLSIRLSRRYAGCSLLLWHLNVTLQIIWVLVRF